MKKIKINKLTLKLKDYIIFNGGLKIENVSYDNVIEFKLPNKYTVDKINDKTYEV